MIYSEPVFNPGGDRFIEMELGDEMSFKLNFLVHNVSGLIRKSKTKGIIEIVPELSAKSSRRLTMAIVKWAASRPKI